MIRLLCLVAVLCLASAFIPSTSNAIMRAGKDLVREWILHLVLVTSEQSEIIPYYCLIAFHRKNVRPGDVLPPQQ